MPFCARMGNIWCPHCGHCAPMTGTNHRGLGTKACSMGMAHFQMALWWWRVMEFLHYICSHQAPDQTKHHLLVSFPYPIDDLAQLMTTTHFSMTLSQVCIMPMAWSLPFSLSLALAMALQYIPPPNHSRRLRFSTTALHVEPGLESLLREGDGVKRSTCILQPPPPPPHIFQHFCCILWEGSFPPLLPSKWLRATTIVLNQQTLSVTSRIPELTTGSQLSAHVNETLILIVHLDPALSQIFLLEMDPQPMAGASPQQAPLLCSHLSTSSWFLQCRMCICPFWTIPIAGSKVMRTTSLSCH